ncbi:MAG: DUF4494 domain-containing protein [Prevotellaceae bacterium]|nr:DUF4494 domain-containing protein [Prevotellaceae bacterium]MDY5672927.1 DUF4494 domain-containing protein [Bacteroidaceae bacterium]MEE1242162.1 DUF4494 domain-containing protein [Bacteroidaceae bacterium]
MAKDWFECKVRYDKTLETGLLKKVTESYLVDALSFTEAEERFLQEIEPMMSGEYSVSDIKRAKIAELFESIDTTDDKWYKAKVAYIAYDEKKGVEKRTNQIMLIQAKDLRVAVQNLDKGMQGTMGDWDIISIAETPIMDIFKFTADGKASSSEDK